MFSKVCDVFCSSINVVDKKGILLSLGFVDGPIYHKRVAILSLRGSVRLNFYRTLSDSADRENDRCALSLLVEPRSLLVFTDELYTDYWHGITEVESDLITDKVVNRDACSKIVGEEVQRERTRLSLTVRHVPLEQAES